ncbi:hypothetical protein JXR01_01650 [Candidatus Kaiserbacteria bacterium]|nr:MAG: hypothetical protein JXR01_01650 [Candidatus Kaiserbacteria bacterium]
MNIKWITLSIAVIIIIVAAWFVFTPRSADAPAADEVAADSSQAAGGTQLAGTEFDGTLDTDIAFDHQAVLEGNTMEEEPMGDPVFHALVSYTNEGFEPQSVTIQKGETVRFVNQADAGMWVGGNNHPTHTNYPETSEDACLGTSFDTCRALQAGEFWEFTFNNIGEWGFHNHIRARDGGTIVVQ